VRARLSSALHDVGAVKTVVFNTETIDSYRKSLQSVNMIVVVLVVAAAALAFIVLYNLTNINIVERTREIASLKVLGFTPREVAAYIFREIALLVVLGAAAGLALGVLMEGFVVLSSEVDAVMFGRVIHGGSFAWAFGLTLVFAAFVMLAMLPKLRHIDMVESLKSVD
jgi:putative ABC transport system permease protein